MNLSKCTSTTNILCHSLYKDVLGIQAFEKCCIINSSRYHLSVTRYMLVDNSTTRSTSGGIPMSHGATINLEIGNACNGCQRACCSNHTGFVVHNGLLHEGKNYNYTEYLLQRRFNLDEIRELKWLTAYFTAVYACICGAGLPAG